MVRGTADQLGSILYDLKETHSFLQQVFNRMYDSDPKIDLVHTTLHHLRESITTLEKATNYETQN